MKMIWLTDSYSGISDVSFIPVSSYIFINSVALFLGSIDSCIDLFFIISVVLNQEFPLLGSLLVLLILDECVDHNSGYHYDETYGQPHDDSPDTQIGEA